MKAASMTLGCKVNQADTAALMGMLRESGYEICPWNERADLYLINTCTVTASTDQQSRQAIRQAHRRNPSAHIIVTGCYAQIDPSALARIEGVDLIFGNGEKSDLIQHLKDLAHGGAPRISVGDILQERSFRGGAGNGLPLRSRPLLKIQEGCNGGCTYCIVPRARGPERSLPPGEVRGQFSDLLAQGFKEIVFTGIRLGAYGRDLDPPTDLSSLLLDLLSLPGSWRLRLGSLEPQDISPLLVTVLQASPRWCRHLHLPLQNGDDEILASMGRPYRAEDYRELLSSLAHEIPQIALGADIIVGFPGETEVHFLRTLRFLEAAPLSYLHIFPFSPRPGTAAALLPHAPSPAEKRNRCRQLRILGREKALRFRAQFIGKRLEAMVLRKRDRKSGRWHALSDHYAPLLIQGEKEEWGGRLIQVEITGMEDGILLGQ